MHDERVAPLGHVPAPDGLRAALRALRPLVGNDAITIASAALPLERFAMSSDPPSVASCTVLETSSRTINAEGGPHIDAFLDGIQRTRVIGHVNASPILFATVAAAIRQRVERRLETWHAPKVRHVVIGAREHMGESAWEVLAGSGVDLVDATETSTVPLHPLAVRTRALDMVAQERETLERRLAADWCQHEARWLWIDGGISGNLAVDAASPAFGVVKSHTTLYGDTDALRQTMGLSMGERGPLFLVQHRSRRAVASWYLRMHRADDGDPLHGLVRVEVAPPANVFPGHSTATPDVEALAKLSSRADHISEWMLAERAPIALPDPRWDTLTYGVYACEQFLKALIGTS